MVEAPGKREERRAQMGLMPNGGVLRAFSIVALGRSCLPRSVSIKTTCAQSVCHGYDKSGAIADR